MAEKTLRHDRSYWMIDGHMVTASFSETPNSDLFPLIRDILLGEDGTHICESTSDHAKMRGDVP